ncbi:hypothetical protein ACIQUQ_28955 [Streptomyces sp. NPDC101118]|uniref:hypothetical protein n=1 Tax=Streptomyces sp. NPDC101118 TaxID=3366109 RepID=UPI00381086B2
MWITRLVASGATVAALVLGPVTAAAADGTPSPSASEGTKAGPTEAGTSFRTAVEVGAGQRATAQASAGDYLYWSFAADAGQRPTVKARVSGGSGSRWQLDVYDGLRRRQSCVYGAAARTTESAAGDTELACTLRTVRAWAEPWANDPLPGTYYVRLTAVAPTKADLGVPVQTEVLVTAAEAGGSAAVDGTLAVPLVPGIAKEPPAGTGAEYRMAKLFSGEPDDGWASGWWTDRWLWTAAGGVLAAVAGVFGYRLTRGTGRPSHLPPAA